MTTTARPLLDHAERMHARLGAGVPCGASRAQRFASRLRAEQVTDESGKQFAEVVGYASVTEKPYPMWDKWGEYTEVVDAAAFDATLAASPDVVFLLNHAGLAMARTTNGSLELSVDPLGLRSTARLNPTRRDVADLLAAIGDGIVDEMSFAFRIVDGEWNDDYTEYRILATDLDRGDVSAVNYGANPHTSIAARTQALMDAIDHLDGPALRAAQRRLAARLPHPASGGDVATLQRLLQLDGDH